MAAKSRLVRHVAEEETDLFTVQDKRRVLREHQRAIGAGSPVAKKDPKSDAIAIVIPRRANDNLTNQSAGTSFDDWLPPARENSYSLAMYARNN